MNRQLRKAIKTEGHFPSEDTARERIYLAITNAVPALTRTRNWTTADSLTMESESEWRQGFS